MRKRRNRKLRKAMVYFLTAGLLLSIGSGTSVLAGSGEDEAGQTETGNSIQTVQETGPPGEQLTEQQPETETSGETETNTEVQTEQTETETVETGLETASTLSGNDSEAARNVQSLIEALPSVEDVQGMDDTDRQAAYMQTQEVNDAYEALSAEEQAQVDQRKIEALFDYFNSLTTTTGTISSVQTEDSVAEVNGMYYTDFQEALEATYNNQSAWCTLLQDVTVYGNVGQDYSSTPSPPCWQINLNGHTLKCDSLLMYAVGNYSQLQGPGTVEANIEVDLGIFTAPLTVNGDISQSGITSLKVMGSGIFRVNGDIGDFNNSSNIDSDVTIVCTGDCNLTDIQERVITAPYKVEVTWGSMEFTYTEAKTWNPENVSYELDEANSGWTPSEPDRNKITVTDQGYDPVQVTYGYTQTDTAVSGAFYQDTSGTMPVNSPVTLDLETKRTDTVYLHLSGKPTDQSGNSATLGSVTITINQASGGN